MIRESRGFRTYLFVDNASDRPATVGVRRRAASPQPTSGADGGGPGDLIMTVAPGKTGTLGPFDSTPYVQENGDLHIDVDEAFAGVVRACQAPCI